MALEIELKTYEENLPKLLSDVGKYVVVHGNEIEGTYVSYEDALTRAYEKYELSPFLVKRIASADQVAYITRAVVAACHH